MWSGYSVVLFDHGCVNLHIKYHIWDPYDFEDTPLPAGIFLRDRDYRRLHEVYLADEFLITGETKSIHLQWKQGEYRHVKPKDINFSSGNKTYDL
jgi:hypothetical protein